MFMKEAVVNATKISVRESRAQSAKQLGTLSKNDTVIVLDTALDQDYAMIIWKTGYAYSESGKYIRLTGSAEPPEANAVVTANTISVREGRGVSHTRLGYYHKNDEIAVLDAKLDKEYAKCIWQIGYAYSAKGKYLVFKDSEPEIPTEPNAIVTANTISVRKARSAGSTKLGEYHNGDKIIVLDSALDREYAMVSWEGGTAYAYSLNGKYIRFLTDSNTVSAKVKSVTDIAKSCVGGKYILGGQGTRITEKYVRARQEAHPSYFTGGRFEYLLAIGKKCDAAGAWKFPDDYAWDCSGLWWYSANKAGVYGKSTDSTAHGFYHNYCTPIEKADLQPGDAVFYQNSSGKITHMAVVGEGGVVYEAMSGYTGVVLGSSVSDRTAPKIVGSGNLTRNAWNKFGRPEIFEE
jgi:cell wall-associated NlpC family hydrolase